MTHDELIACFHDELVALVIAIDDVEMHPAARPTLNAHLASLSRALLADDPREALRWHAALRRKIAHERAWAQEKTAT